MILSFVRFEKIYMTIKILSEQKKYPVCILCEIGGVSRSGYYKWLRRDKSRREIENEKLVDLIKEAYEERGGILGYRQMTIKLFREHNLKINHKRVYRLMRIAGLRSVCRKKRYNYIKSTIEVIAENVLNREFKAETVCEKWVTDVTELRYGDGKKAYLSAILDLGDKSIVAYSIGHSNNNELVIETFEAAISVYPEARPIFHSDRGFQYTSKAFKSKLDDMGMVQSMSRVGCCIDNGPMEGFWGTLKSEMYYLNKFNDYESLKKAVEDYIDYYNTKRYQKRLNCMTPLEYRNHLLDISR